jgi:sterol carrier protein 2
LCGSERVGFERGSVAAQIFGNAGIEYMEKYGAKPEHFAEIARINHAHR